MAWTDTATQIPLNGWMSDPKWKEVGTFCQLAFEQDIEGMAFSR